jgi:aminoglycoside phosphotransferase (APT) family kinase protein
VPSGDESPAVAPELAAALAEVLAEPLGGAVEVRSLTRLSGGASRETWSADAVAPDGTTTGVVLQRERAGGGARTAPGGMAAEERLLRAAASRGVPVAAVLASGDGGPVGAPHLVLGRVEGETIPRRILRDPALDRARDRLTAQVGAALAAIHRIELDEVPGLDATDLLQQCRDLLDLLRVPRPGLELGLRRLEATRPPTTGSGVVHGDLRLGNVIVDGDGLAAVLDWELAHIGDPAEDLGWFCARAWRFGSPRRAGGVGSAEELLDAYAAAGGVRVAPDTLRWWEAVACLRWGVICGVQLAAHLGGASRSVELAAIGRRTAECEEDLLELVAGPDPYVPPGPDDVPPPLSGPYGRPTADELLEAVAEHLTDLRSELSGRQGFHARVAANVVGMVRRQLALGESAAADHRERLAGLGVDDDAGLVAAIRSGSLDDRWEETAGVVRASVRDALAVAHPGYWEGDT